MRAQNIAREAEQNLRGPILSTDDALRQNFERGIIHGQRSVVILPKQIIQLGEEERRNYLENLDE